MKNPNQPAGKTMRYLTVKTLVCALTLGGGLGLAQSALANPQMAVEMGCYNCHGAQLRADAPSFERLSEKFSKHKGDLAEERRHAEKLREGEFLQHFTAHQQLSPESAQKLVHWLAEGAK
jgi:cytochrome c